MFLRCINVASFIFTSEQCNHCTNRLTSHLISLQEALAEEARQRAKFENDTEIAKAKRDYELKKAAYDIEVQTKVCKAKFVDQLMMLGCCDLLVSAFMNIH